jgi:hypothetical protein
MDLNTWGTPSYFKSLSLLLPQTFIYTESSSCTAGGPREGTEQKTRRNNVWMADVAEETLGRVLFFATNRRVKVQSSRATSFSHFGLSWWCEDEVGLQRYGISIFYLYPGHPKIVFQKA